MASHPNDFQSTVSQHDGSAAAVTDSLAGLRLDPTSAGSSEHAAGATARHGAEPRTPSRRERANYLSLHPSARQRGPHTSLNSPTASPSRYGNLASPRSTGTPRSATPLNTHLYISGLLNASLSDLSLLVFGRIYKLHRLVLCQSPFFQSLLLGGFSETAETEAFVLSPSESARPLKLELEPNITRAAFEYCLGQLYGGGLQLAILPWTDTSVHPLGEAYTSLAERTIPSRRSRPNTGNTRSNAAQHQWQRLVTSSGDEAVNGIHPASPRFLLSLLVTASYFEVTEVANTAMEMILNSITPFSLHTYLNFAVGKGITGWYGPAEREQPCRGLEGVAGPPIADDAGSESVPSGRTYDYGSLSEKIGEACACYLAKWGVSHILPVEEAASGLGATSSTHVHRPSALPSTGDNLSPSVQALLDREPWLKTPQQKNIRVWAYGGMPIDWVKGVLASDALYLGSQTTRDKGSEWNRYQVIKRVVELRRVTRQRDDAELFSKVEKGKGKAKEVYEERDSQKGMQTAQDNFRAESFGSEASFDYEEGMLEEILETAVLYSHFSFQDLMALQHDISPTTGQPYVPLHLSQAAHWTSSRFLSLVPGANKPSLYGASDSSSSLNKVTAGSTGGSSGMSTPKTISAPVLGAAVHLLPDGEAQTPNRDQLHPQVQRYFLIPSDSTFRTNEEGPAVQPLLSPKVLSQYETSQPAQGLEEATNTNYENEHSEALPTGAKRFFGLTSIHSKLGVAVDHVRRPSLQPGLPSSAVTPRWIPFEPCRVSLEWFISSELRGQQRLYSRTWTYGGSYWNCYLQLQLGGPFTSAGTPGGSGKKKAPQIGCYLHRQSMLEPIPAASQPPALPETLDTGARALIDPYSEDSPYTSSSSPPSMSALRRNTSPTLPGGRAASGSFSSNLQGGSGLQPAESASSSLMGASMPYVDQRKLVACHFSIHLFNRAGTALANFTSEPSDFAVAQSWGYKSGKLLSEEYLGGKALDILMGTLNQDTNLGGNPGREAGAFDSLKATVTMGLV